MIYKRNCPDCNCELTYKSKSALNLAYKKNGFCRKCSQKGERNAFFGKHHSKETIELLSKQDKSYTKTKEFSDKVKQSMIGIDTSVNLIELWTEKYGKEEAEKREFQRRKKLSETMSGEGNPMYGKPSPRPAGGGVKGWYHDHFFRSLRELTYMLFLVENNKEWKSAEATELRIHYVNPYTSKNATYVADFLVEDKFLVECKPKNLQDTRINQAKTEAAEKFCQENDLIYQIIDPDVITWKKLFELVESGSVVLTERTREKLRSNENYDHSKRASRER